MAGHAPPPSLLYAVSDGVATLTLNRPEKLNAFDDVLLTQCLEALQNAKADDAVRAVIITGAGKGFCSGADVGGMNPEVEVTPLSVKTRIQNGLQRLPLALADFDKPVIAAVNGVAAGAGMDLALMCDLRFAGASARFIESYVKLGLIPGMGGAYFLPRVVGTAKALELLWSAEPTSAEDAHKIGLVNRVYADDELQQRTHEFAVKLAKSPPLSIRLIKRAVYQGQHSDLKTGLELIAAYLPIVRTSRDQAEAIAAFRDKREGHYEGR
jgi:enoyl-CoA hydratase/carnithine racemase